MTRANRFRKYQHLIQTELDVEGIPGVVRWVDIGAICVIYVWVAKTDFLATVRHLMPLLPFVSVIILTDTPPLIGVP